MIKSKSSLRNEENLMDEQKDFLLDASRFSKGVVVGIFRHPPNNDIFSLQVLFEGLRIRGTLVRMRNKFGQS